MGNERQSMERQSPQRLNRGQHSGRSRRAAVTLFLYAFAALVLPGWHLVAHRPDHEHTADVLRHVARALLPSTLRQNPAVASHHASHTHHHHETQASSTPSAERPEAVSFPPRSPGGSEGQRLAPLVAAGDLEGFSHGLGSLAHFACAYLAAAVVRLLFCVGLLCAERLQASRAAVLHARFIGCPIGARAPPLSDSVSH